MTGLLFALLLFVPPVEAPGGQAFRLSPGDYRWIPLPVKHTPAYVEVRYEVLQGSPTVHAEILAVDDRRRRSKGEAQEPLAFTAPSRVGGLHKLLLAKGQYRVLVMNGGNGSTATISLNVRMDSSSFVARELTPNQRLTVILLSFLFFMTTICVAGWRLLRGMQVSPAAR